MHVVFATPTNCNSPASQGHRVRRQTQSITRNSGTEDTGAVAQPLNDGASAQDTTTPSRGAHPHKIWGGELDCGTDFPIGVRATFFWGGGQRAYCPTLRGPNLTRCHHSLRRARKF